MSVASTGTVHELAAYRSEFPVFERHRYLNTCSLGPLSRRSRQAVGSFLDAWETRGAPAWYDVWWDALAAVRGQYAHTIDARAEEIALHASVSTATAVVAGALDYRHRPRIVTTALDFPTIVYQWLARRPEVEVVVLESPDGVSVPLEAYESAVNDRTALVVTSHVFFTTGVIQDIRAIARIAHRHGALCFVDAYQSVGQIPFSAHDAEVDFLCSGGLKWLLGGPGIVFLYARADLVPTLIPSVTGWFAHARQFDFDPASLAWHADARRLEQGTPALSAVYAQLGALELILEIGIPRIWRVTRDLTADLVEQASRAGLAPRIAEDPAARSAIVTIPRRDPPAAVRRLAAAGIVVDARPGLVRLSPFFYNVRDDYLEAIDVLQR